MKKVIICLIVCLAVLITTTAFAAEYSITATGCTVRLNESPYSEVNSANEGTMLRITHPSVASGQHFKEWKSNIELTQSQATSNILIVEMPDQELSVWPEYEYEIRKVCFAELSNLSNPIEGDPITDVTLTPDVCNENMQASDIVEVVEAKWVKVVRNKVIREVSGDFLHGREYALKITLKSKDFDHYYFRHNGYFIIDYYGSDFLYAHDFVEEFDNDDRSEYYTIYSLEHCVLNDGEVRVSFDPNGGEIWGELEDPEDLDDPFVIVADNQEINTDTLPSCELLDSDLVFEGWFTGGNFDYTLPSYFENANLKLTANFAEAIPMPIILEENRQLEYNGEMQSPIITNYDEDKMHIYEESVTSAREVYSQYQRAIIIAPNSGYVWDIDFDHYYNEGHLTRVQALHKDIYLTWGIVPAKLELPVLRYSTMEFEQDGVYNEFENYSMDDGRISYTGMYSEELGDFTVTVSLNDTSNYKWIDGTTNPIELSWKVVPKKHTIITDFNGGTYVQNDPDWPQVQEYEDGYVVTFSLDVFDCLNNNVTAPYGYEFDCFEISGERYELNSSFTLMEDITLKLLWKRDLNVIFDIPSVTILGINVPAIDALPSTTCTIASGDNATVINGPRWYKETYNGMARMVAGDRFEAGKAYKLKIAIKPDTGYRFFSNFQTGTQFILDGVNGVYVEVEDTSEEIWDVIFNIGSAIERQVTRLERYDFNLTSIPAPVSGDVIQNGILEVISVNNGEVPLEELELLDSKWMHVIGGNVYEDVSGEFIYGNEYVYVVNYSIPYKQYYNTDVYVSTNLETEMQYRSNTMPDSEDDRPYLLEDLILDTSEDMSKVDVQFITPVYTVISDDCWRITFSANGGYFREEASSGDFSGDTHELYQIIEKGKIMSIPEPPLSYDSDYVFVGWAGRPNAATPLNYPMTFYGTNGESDTRYNYFFRKRATNNTHYYAVYRKQIDQPYIDENEILRYTGEEIHPTIYNYDPEVSSGDIEVIWHGDEAIYPRQWEYTVEFALNYEVSNDYMVWKIPGKTYNVDQDLRYWLESISYQYYISNGQVKRPQLVKDENSNPITTYYYTGNTIIPQFESYTSGDYEKVVIDSQREVGHFALRVVPAQYYEWDSGDDLLETIEFEIDILPSPVEKVTIYDSIGPIENCQPVMPSYAYINDNEEFMCMLSSQKIEVETEHGFEEMEHYIECSSDNKYRIFMEIKPYDYPNFYFDDNTQFTMAFDRDLWTYQVDAWESEKEEGLWYVQVTFDKTIKPNYIDPPALKKNYTLVGKGITSEYFMDWNGDMYSLSDRIPSKVGRFSTSLTIKDYPYNCWSDGNTGSQMYYLNAVMKGDLDINSDVNTVDIRLFLQEIINASENPEWNEREMLTMDMDESGTINVTDIRLLLQEIINS